MDPAEYLISASVAQRLCEACVTAKALAHAVGEARSHTSTATILLNNFDWWVFNFYLLSFILAYDLAFKTIPDSLYL